MALTNIETLDYVTMVSHYKFDNKEIFDYVMMVSRYKSDLREKS